MGKIKETQQLYKEILAEISKSAENWTIFLESSAWNFKYDFDDQILIYAQRPDARACATMGEWNKKLKRWVNIGAKPIYIFDKEPYSEYPFKLVFDLSDTHNYNNTEYKLWNIKKEYEDNIIESLEANFGDIESKESLSQAIIHASYNMVTDNVEDYITSIIKNKTNTNLENIQDEEIKNMFITTAWASVSYVIMTRCGINAKEHINEQEFACIKYFSNKECLSVLGSSVSDIAEMGLREIAKTITNLRKKEKLKNRTFAKFDDKAYSNDNEIIKGGNEDDRENRIHETRRLLYAESNNEKGDSTTREIRIDEIQLSEKPQKTRTNDIENESEIDRTFDRNTGTSKSESRNISGTNETNRGDNRENESTRPNGLGGIDEQHQIESRGDSSGRNDLQLEENTSKKRTLSEKEREPNREFLQDKYVRALLSNTQNLNVSKNDIKEFYKTHSSIDERTKYIKQAFNDAYTEIVVDDTRLGYKTYENVLHLWKDSYTNRTAEVYYKWEIVAEYIEGLIMVNEFNDLHKSLPNFENQTQMLQVEAVNAPTFYFTQEIIDHALQNGGNVENSKMRIYNQFKESLSSQKNITFLKNEYGLGGNSTIHIGTGISIEYAGTGITLRRGYKEDNPKLTISWNNVEKRISELIKLDRYLNSKEKAKYENWLKQNELEKQVNENKKQLLNSEKNAPKYEYHLGDTVYIGAEQYEIVGIKDNIVTLYDPKFPLLNKQMSFEEFERKVKDNYANEHLKVENRDNDELEDKQATNSIEQNNSEEQPIGSKQFLINMFEKYQITNYNIETNDNDEIEQVKIDGIDYYCSYVEILKYLLENMQDYNEQFVKDDEIKINNELYKARQKQEQELINKEVKEENKIYTVIKIDGQQDSEDYAVIQDKETKETTIETVGYIKSLIDQQKQVNQENIATFESLYHQSEKNHLKESIKPNIIRPRNKIQDFILHPEVPISDRNNYKITNDNLGVGTPREKFARNIAAIKVLKKCENENRYATPEEQEILSKYVGWGGLADVFDKNKTIWAEEYKTLKEVLNEEEYKNARASTLTAFYTPPIVIDAMYKILQNMGLKEANVLEPSCRYWKFLWNATR